MFADQTPQMLLGEGTIVVAEFDGIANPAIALYGSGKADAPNIAINLNTTGHSNINIAYNVRDLDGAGAGGPAPNATASIVLRLTNTGATPLSFTRRLFAGTF